MSIPFQDSETAKNLLRAFAGESQARNRYDFAANLCQKQELQAMAFIFQATAKQEQAHAKVFWDHLQALNGQNLPIYGAYPIEGTNRILELLRAAQHNEQRGAWFRIPLLRRHRDPGGLPGGRRLLPADCRH